MYTPKPFNEGYLEEQDGHKVYYAQYGNPDGEVVVSLHGGPGSRSKAKHVASFDETIYQVVIFDQRGCGKSEPFGTIEASTTQSLVADMERLREQLGLDTWHVAGSSWGSTLALVYAETHPERVKSLLLSAIFLGYSDDVNWSFSATGGLRTMMPDVWEVTKEIFGKVGYSEDQFTDPEFILNELDEGDVSKQQHIAAGFMNWEGNAMRVNENPSFIIPDDVTEEQIAETVIFMHYWANSFFLKENQVLNDVSRIEEIPTIIVQGRFDILCPLRFAWELHKALPSSKLVTLAATAHQFSGEGQTLRKLAFSAFLNELR